MRAARLREWTGRAALVGLGLVAMTAGLAVGSMGCGLCIRDCPYVEPVQPGVFEIVESPERPELVGGVVDASDDGVEISFMDAEGNPWVISYSIEYKTGG
jgi:hypothetical protein